MNESTTTERCDAAAVNVIVDGRFTDAGNAIGQANIPTLQLAAQRCREAMTEARGKGEAWKQFHDRSIICTARIKKIKEQQAASF